MVKNNVTRLLQGRKITHQVFELPAEKLGAQETARLLHVPPGEVFKSIVLTGEPRSKPVLALVAANQQVDVKAVAAALGEKKLQRTTQAQAEALTGLQTGGISPLALINQGWRVVIDDSAKALVSMHVSGGQRGLNIRLSPQDLAKLTNARFAAIGTPLSEDEGE